MIDSRIFGRDVQFYSTLVDRLQDWIENHNDRGKVQYAWVTFSNSVIQFGIGPFDLWDSENGYSDGQENTELSFDGVIHAFLDEIANLMIYFPNTESAIEHYETTDQEKTETSVDLDG